MSYEPNSHYWCSFRTTFLQTRGRCSWQQDKLDMAGMQEVTEAPVVQAVEAVLGTPQP